MLKRLSFVLICFTSLASMTGCSQARYAAHVVKQVPMLQDKPSQSKGYFKVGSSYTIKGKRYYPKERYDFTQTGTASWYGPGFHGKQTANGEIFDKNELTAAHRTLQLPSVIKVTNLDNGRQVVLRVNDRGPFAHERILDVSERAASLLGFKNKGVAKIKLEVMEKESREVASVSKSGKSTKGYEDAYNNQNNQTVTSPSSTVTQNVIEPVVTQTATATAGPPQSVFTNTTANNARLPSVQAQELDEIVQNAVRPNETLTADDIQNKLSGGQKMFVQAGSFTQENNALNYSSKLANLGASRVYMARVNDQPYFRVRLGPYNDPQQAQTAINALNASGNNNAVLIIE